MIDWIIAKIPLRHQTIASGAKIDVDADGVVINEFRKTSKVRGSYDSSIQVKSQKQYGDGAFSDELFLDGNPAKFIQGHNVIGGDDCCFLVAEAVKSVFQTLNIPLDEFSYRRILSGEFQVLKVDINYTYELPTKLDVDNWLFAARSQLSCKNRGTPKWYDGSVYIGLGSRRWHMKAYSKFTELMTGKKSHKLPDELLKTPLLAYTENKLRIEFSFRGMEIERIAKRHTNTRQLLGKHLSAATCRHIFNSYLERIDMSAQQPLTDAKLHALPAHLRTAYTCWLNGYDMKKMYPNRMTFYRHRKALKQICSVDIASSRTNTEVTNNVISLSRPLRAEPAAIPQELLKYCIGM